MTPRVEELIRLLDLQPHPEGGYFKEVFRSAETVTPADGRGVRSGLTTIFFLLPEGEHSRWHKVSSDEVWHHYEGAPLELLRRIGTDGAIERLVLGPLSAAGAFPVHTIAAGQWQAARSLGEYTLVGCTVGPGFDFADFTLD